VALHLKPLLININQAYQFKSVGLREQSASVRLPAATADHNHMQTTPDSDAGIFNGCAFCLLVVSDER